MFRSPFLAHFRSSPAVLASAQLKMVVKWKFPTAGVEANSDPPKGGPDHRTRRNIEQAFGRRG